MSPAGFGWGTTSYVWFVNSLGSIDYSTVNSARRLRPVLNLTADTQISGGDGSKENPFTIE